MTVRYATEHRCGVAVSGPGLSDAVGDTDPLKDKLPLLKSKPTDDSPEVGCCRMQGRHKEAGAGRGGAGGRMTEAP